MRLRTAEDVVDITNHDLAWRRLELSSLDGQLRNAEGTARAALLRAGVTLLYAHWEGFVKNAATYYLKFVGHQRRAYADLQRCFLRLALRMHFGAVVETKKVAAFDDVAAFVDGCLGQKLKVNADKAIRTEANLNCEVLSNIVACIGIEYAPFGQERMRLVLDERLLNWRNSIAHGEYNPVDEDEWDVLYHDVWVMLDVFCNEVQNAAVRRRYLRNPS